MQARARALYYSVVRSTTDNMWERHTSLTLIADPFEVKGSILNDERIMLTGEAPRVGRNCHPDGSYTSNLEFRRLKQNAAAQTQEPLAAQRSPIAVSKPDVPSVSSAESAPQPSVKNETPVEAKDSSAGVTDPKVRSTTVGQTPVTNETTEAKDLRYYLLGAGFIVMIVWLLIVLFGKTLIRRMGWDVPGGCISAFMTSGQTATRSAATAGFKKSNNFGALLSGGEAAIGLHLITRHYLVGISDKALKRRPIPCQTGVLHGT
jgi:hypothetical protein